MVHFITYLKTSFSLKFISKELFQEGFNRVVLVLKFKSCSFKSLFQIWHQLIFKKTFRKLVRSLEVPYREFKIKS